jgi:hypothetical protein
MACQEHQHSAKASRNREVSGSNLIRSSYYPEVSYGFHQFFQTNAGIIASNRPWRILSILRNRSLKSFDAK